MNTQINDNALISVLFERYKKQRLPRMEQLIAKVERGESLMEFDMQFLQEVAHSINDLKPFLHRHEECNQLATHMMNLCANVANKGLANENSTG